MPPSNNRKIVVAAYGGPDRLELVQDVAAAPGEGAVRIRVEASSAVYTDALIRRGVYPYLRDRRTPLDLGYDLVGVVEQVGPGVDPVLLGQRVADLTQLGANAEVVTRPATGLVLVPDGVDPVEAEPLILTFLTAYQMLVRVARVRPGQRVLITPGTGGVGHALLQLGRELGLQMVATASAAKLDEVTAYGAAAVDRDAPDLERRLQTAVDGHLDAAFDGVAGSSTRRSFRLLGPGGTLVTYGAVGPLRAIKRRSPLTQAVIPLLLAADTRAARRRNRQPDGPRQQPYDINTTRRDQPAWFHQDLTELFRLLAAGKIRPVIDEVVPLAEAARAHQRIDDGAVHGRLVLVP